MAFQTFELTNRRGCMRACPSPGVQVVFWVRPRRPGWRDGCPEASERKQRGGACLGERAPGARRSFEALWAEADAQTILRVSEDELRTTRTSSRRRAAHIVHTAKRIAVASRPPPISSQATSPSLARPSCPLGTSHWKTKGCTAWSKQYFVDRLVGQSVASGASGHQLKIERIETFDGDVELGNRKGKLITIYDVDMALEWVAVAQQGGEADDAAAGASSSSSSSSTAGATVVARGKIRFPEVSHEVEDQGDEYTWETTLDAGGDGEEKDRQAAYQAVKKDLVKMVLPVLHQFRATLVDTHARDLGHSDSPASSSGQATPATGGEPASAAPAKPAAASATTTKVSSSSSSSVKVSSEAVQLEGRNACSKDDLWDLLTNQARIPMWTRAPAQFVPLAGHDFSLFNGNVTGKVQSVSSPDELVLSWRPPTWQPADHFGTLKLTLSQQDEATLLRIHLTGVPEGEEESSKKALDEFYLNGLRRLGLGTMI
ncbi:unnamed protein product [Parajaminaea phylloscopi]